MSVHFESALLVGEIIGCESMPRPAKQALQAIASQVQFHSSTEDRRSFTFQILNSNLPDGCTYLTVRAIKGSLHTVLWSTFARFDDEYALYYHSSIDDIHHNYDNIYIVWSVKGVDAVNAKISKGMIDWFLLRRIQSILKATTVGVLAFTKMLGRYLLSVPNFIKYFKYYPPMPATFMFNYLMMVCYCPFELTLINLPRFLSQSSLYLRSSHQSHTDLLKAFIMPNGSGAWIPEYVPIRQATGSLVLQYSPRVHYTQRLQNLQDSHSSLGDGPDGSQGGFVTIENDTRVERESKELIELQQWQLYATLSNAASPHRHTLGKEIAVVLRETAVRVVELRPHSLGVDGYIVVIEYVHNRHWSKIIRFIAVDAYKICLAIKSAGQTPPQQIQQIEIFDAESWATAHPILKQELNSSTSCATTSLATVLRKDDAMFSTVTRSGGSAVQFLLPLPLDHCVLSPFMSPILGDMDHSGAMFSPRPYVDSQFAEDDRAEASVEEEKPGGDLSLAGMSPAACVAELFGYNGGKEALTTSEIVVSDSNCSPRNSDYGDLLLVDMAAPDDPIPSGNNPWSKTKPTRSKRKYDCLNSPQILRSSGLIASTSSSIESKAKSAAAERAAEAAAEVLDTASLRNSCEWGAHTGDNKKPSDFYVTLILTLQSHE